MWLSLVERCVRDAEVVSSNLAIPTIIFLERVYFVYILKSTNTGRYYVGHTDDLERRLTEHNAGYVKSTKAGTPWERLYSESFPDRSTASARERQIKSWKDSAAISRLIETGDPWGRNP